MQGNGEPEATANAVPVHYKATVEYDGTDFFGFQRQASARSVQGVLEEALARLNHQLPVRVQGAGRTDTGVHATGQVVDFSLAWSRPDEALLRAMNAILPGDVALRDLSRVAPGFHSRWSATGRAYRYTIWNSPERSPLLRRQALHVAEPLDVKAMDEALTLMCGVHDFASFGLPTQGDVTIRHLRRASATQSGPLIYLDLEASGFLYRMVRSIVGTVLLVGRGQKPPQWMGEVLAARDRAAAAAPVLPVGLCLTTVSYDQKPENNV